MYKKLVENDIKRVKYKRTAIAVQCISWSWVERCWEWFVYDLQSAADELVSAGVSCFVSIQLRLSIFLRTRSILLQWIGEFNSYRILALDTDDTSVRYWLGMITVVWRRTLYTVICKNVAVSAWLGWSAPFFCIFWSLLLREGTSTRLARHFRRRVRRRTAALFADAKSSFTITMCVVTTWCQLVFLN